MAALHVGSTCHSTAVRALPASALRGAICCYRAAAFKTLLAGLRPLLPLHPRCTTSQMTGKLWLALWPNGDLVVARAHSRSEMLEACFTP